MSIPIVRVHWLNDSRAFRLLWLLDHLEIEYEIIPYKRINNRAPDSLKKIHPLGRSPLLEIEDRETGKKKILAESGYIFQYILQNFDKENKLGNSDPEMAERISYYLFYVEGSLQTPLLMEYIFSLAKQSPGPFPLSYLVKSIVDKIRMSYSKEETKNQFDYIENDIGENQGYLVGGKLSGADILMSFPIHMAFIRKFISPEEYPNMNKWLNKITSIDSYAISKEKVKVFESDI